MMWGCEGEEKQRVCRCDEEEVGHGSTTRSMHLPCPFVIRPRHGYFRRNLPGHHPRLTPIRASLLWQTSPCPFSRCWATSTSWWRRQRRTRMQEPRRSTLQRGSSPSPRTCPLSASSRPPLRATTQSHTRLQTRLETRPSPSLALSTFATRRHRSSR